MKKLASALFLLLPLLIGLCVFRIRTVDASGTISINADGSINPTTAPISTTDNVTYTFTDNINSSIVIERNDTIIDGRGYTLNGTGSPMFGISLDGISNVTIENIEVIGFPNCIWVQSSNNINISRNNILMQQHSMSIYPDGIYLFMSSNSTVMENQVSVTTSFGIRLEASYNNTIIGNNVTDNSGIGISPLSGIALYTSSYNLFRNNSVVGNSSYLSVVGSSIVDLVNDLDSSNTVGGKPVCYWINQENKTVPANSGSVSLINCSNINAENLVLSNGDPAIMLVNTYNSTISRNALGNNYIGAILLGSYNNSIFENDITGNLDGIHLNPFGDSNTSNNIFFENNISGNNLFGIWGFQCSDNTFYHNNFINNTWTNVVLLTNDTEVWNNGYPSGGNYWSDYRGNDTYSGIYQNETGYDGIGDSPYVIDRNNSDIYPLMQPFDSELQDSRVAYRDLLSRFNSLFLQFQALNSTLNNMQANMSSLNSTSTNLQESIGNLTITLNSLRDELQRQINSLNNNNTILNQSLTTLQAQLDSINSTLQESFDNLLNKNNSLSNQLNNAFYVLYVFVSLIIVLIVTTVYFATRKTKTEKTRL